MTPTRVLATLALPRGKALAWIVLAFALISTAIGWKLSSESAVRGAAYDFSHRVDRITLAIERRMHLYEQALLGGVALFATAQRMVTREEWHNYFNTLRLDQAYPGIRAVGLIMWIPSDELPVHVAVVRAEGDPTYEIKPAGARDVFAPLVYAEPFNGRIQGAIGIDFLAEPVRRAALETARDVGRPILTRKVVLPSNTGKTVVASVLVAPLYKPWAINETIEQRRAAIAGFVAGAIGIEAFFEDVLEEGNPMFRLLVHDDLDGGADNLVYATPDGRPERSSKPRFTATRDIKLPGRVWRVDFESTPPFEASEESGQSRSIALGGCAVSLLLFAIVFTLARQRELVLAKAQAITRDLSESRERFGHFAAASGDWFFETDANLRFTWYAEEVEQHTGFPRSWHYGKTRQVMAAGKVDFTQEPWKSHLATLDRHEPYRDFIYERAAPDGIKWISASGVPVFDAAGNFKGYRGLGRDVTARMALERAAREADERLRLAIDGVPNTAIVLCDPNDRIVLTNRYFREFNARVAAFVEPGRKFEEHLYAQVAFDLAPAARERKEEDFAARLAKRCDPQGSFEALRHDGCWMRVHDHRMADGSTLTISLDITESKRAEAAIAESRARLSLALSGSSVAIWDNDLPTGHIYLSAEWSAMRGGPSVETHTNAR